jgi:hypothetical protein
MIDSNYNVLDVLLLDKKKYIILFSGLEFSPVVEIANNLAKDLNAIVFNFIHLELNDSIEPINKRINQQLEKYEMTPKPFFIIAKSFPSNQLNFTYDAHYNISLHPNVIYKLDPLKRSELPQQYTDSIKKNQITRYINVKKDVSNVTYENEIFDLIIDDIEKKVYGNQYNKLSHKFYNSSEDNNKPIISKLVSDPNSISLKEQRIIDAKKIDKELSDYIDSEAELESSSYNDEDNDELDEVQIFGGYDELFEKDL